MSTFVLSTFQTVNIMFNTYSTFQPTLSCAVYCNGLNGKVMATILTTIKQTLALDRFFSASMLVVPATGKSMITEHLQQNIHNTVMVTCT